MSEIGKTLNNRAGATLAVVLVSLVGLLSVMALAVDMGMMYSARNEAQRVADAAALAGASAFLEFDDFVAPGKATERAREYISLNTILLEGADPDAASINVNMSIYRIEVIVRRPQISTWFARMFGVDSVGVVARAVAEATNAGGARCIRPWAVQDMWHETDEAGIERWPGETDKWDNGNLDRYKPVPPGGPSQADNDETGYGSHHTLHAPNWDRGRRIALKAQQPGGTFGTQPGPGDFLIWQMPDDPTQENCAQGGGGGGGQGGTSPGAAEYRQNICACNKNVIEVGTVLEIQPGNIVGPGIQATNEVINRDPGAYWDESTGQVAGSDPKFGGQSPRVVPIALIKPLYCRDRNGDGQGDCPTNPLQQEETEKPTVTTIALFFLEAPSLCPATRGNQVDLCGRFMYYAPGVAGPVQGPLTKLIRLVE